MARQTPTHERPAFPDEDLRPEEPAPGGQQLLRMVLPVAAAIVVFITALMLVLKFLVIPAMERGDPAVQARSRDHWCTPDAGSSHAQPAGAHTTTDSPTDEHATAVGYRAAGNPTSSSLHDCRGFGGRCQPGS